MANPELLAPAIWSALESASAGAPSPFRTPVLATAGRPGGSLRVVVLRRAERVKRLLVCHSDLRAAKIGQIKENPRVDWLIFDPQERIQSRANGFAAIHSNDAIAGATWREMTVADRINYCSLDAPGAPIAEPNAAWPESWRGRSPTLEETDGSSGNLAVVETVIDRFDWLQLAPDGHRRAGLIWHGDSLEAQWLAP